MKAAIRILSFAGEVLHMKRRAFWLGYLETIYLFNLPLLATVTTLLYLAGAPLLLLLLVAIVVTPLTLMAYALGFTRGAYKILHNRVSAAPAGKLVEVLRFVFPSRAFERIFSQIVIDGREEYFEALAAKRPNLARWRLMQIYLAVVLAATTWLTVSVTQKFIQIWKIGQ